MESPIVDFKDTSCMVCIEDFSTDQAPILILTCGHRIHYRCAHKLTMKVCPLCRSDMKLYDEKKNEENERNEYSAESIINLAFQYYHGHGVDKDMHRAVVLFTDAYQKGSVKAIFNLGVCYLYGLGVDKDEHRAFVLFTEAYQKGDETVTLNLALCYRNGWGVDKDERRAKKLLGETSCKTSCLIL